MRSKSVRKKKCTATFGNTYAVLLVFFALFISYLFYVHKGLKVEITSIGFSKIHSG